LPAILANAVIMVAIMYVVEEGQNGFTSIPQSIYQAIITISTVDYGDTSFDFHPKSYLWSCVTKQSPIS